MGSTFFKFQIVIDKNTSPLAKSQVVEFEDRSESSFSFPHFRNKKSPGEKNALK